MIALGRVDSANAALITAHLPIAALGSAVTICTSRGTVRGDVVGVSAGRAVIAPVDDANHVRPGDEVSSDSTDAFPLGVPLLGRAIDPLGAPLDGKVRPQLCVRRSGDRILQPADRRSIVEPLWTGIRAIDGLLTIGRGARVGLFGAPGAGKSTLIEMLVDGCAADTVVVGLVGERGREAQRWIAQRSARTTIVCATSDRTAGERVRAARVAMAQASALRRRGLHVLLVIDSLMRYAAALREIAIAAGEAAGRAGFPPSVFVELARLIERAGAAHDGSVTLIATVLNDGDAHDPVSEAARSLLDGHIELSSALAHSGHFPAIDVVASASRTMAEVVTDSHLRDASLVRAALASLQSTAESRAAGLIPADPRALRAVATEPSLEAFLKQAGTPSPPGATLSELRALADTLEEDRWTLPPTSPL